MKKNTLIEGKVLDLLQGLSTIKVTLGWTFGEVIDRLNEHLSLDRRIPNNQSGITQVERWLNPTRKGWVEPRAAIILAVQGVVAKYDYILKKGETNLVNEKARLANDQP